MQTILLCSDLDRTILPNGPQPSSPQALPLLRRIASHPHIVLVYVSGRDKRLLEEAIADFNLPLPDFAIGDVGTTIYEPRDNWRPFQEWTDAIVRDWQGRTHEDLAKLFADLPLLQPQEKEKQGSLKLSYYTDPGVDIEVLRRGMTERLVSAGADATIIWSIDEQQQVGLVDVLPKSANKAGAIDFLMRSRGFSEERTMFAGDSGNDLQVLTSGLKSVLVANAAEALRRQADEALRKKGLDRRLYFARGDFLGMNGNYCAGVLEGLAHFFPETLSLMTSA